MSRLQQLSVVSFACLVSLAAASVAATRPTLLPDNIITCQANAGCFNKKMFDRDYKVLRTDRAEIMVSISTEGGYTRADVSILNTDSFPVNVSPEDFRVEVVSPKPHVLLYIAPENLQNLPPDPKVPEVPAEAETPADGTAVNLADSTKPIDIDELYTAKKKRLALLAAAERATAQKHLTPTPVPPNQILRGRVYFERDKHAKEVLITLPIAGQVYQFPYALK